MEAPFFNLQGLPLNKKINLDFLSYQWKSLPSKLTIKQKNGSIQERYLHAGQIYDKKLYIHGGLSLDKNFKDNKTYEFDLLSQSWKHVNCSQKCEVRDSHEFTFYDGKIICFGGSTNHQSCINDVIAFDPLYKSWKRLEVEGELPQQRQLSTFVSIQNQFILMFGGVNYQKEILFDDAYIFKKNKWFRLNVINDRPQRLKYGIAICGNRVFIHGGEGPGIEQVQYYDDIYEIVVQQIELQISFNKIIVNSKQIPIKRSCHGMIQLSHRYFLIIGGETIQNTATTRGEKTTLNDVWIYDIYQKSWKEIKSIETAFYPRKQFLIKRYDTKFIIFGGFQDNYRLKEDTIILQFKYKNFQKTIQCQKCTRLLTSVQQKIYSNTFTISSGFIYNMCMSIRCPFQAIQKIIEIICDLNSSYVKILSEYTTNTQQQYGIFTFSFDGDFISQMKLLEFFSCLEVQQEYNESKHINLLMMLCARLGKTILFVQNDQNKRNVVFFSVEEKHSPQFETAYICYKYIQQRFTQNINPSKGYLDKVKIINILSSFISDPHGFISQIKQSKIFIFSPNIFLTSQKAYYYELIFPDSSVHDVFLFRNQKKIQFMSKANFKMAQTMQFSLKNYLMNCWQAQKYKNVKIYLNNNQQFLQKKSYLQHLHQMSFKGQIKSLMLQKIPYAQKVQLFAVPHNVSLQQNNGIIIFKNGVFVNRLDFPLGSLLAKCFYKKKYRNYQNPFPIVGVIHLSDNIKLINFGTDFKKNKTYNIMKSSLQQCLDKFTLSTFSITQIQKNGKDTAQQTEDVHINNQVQNRRSDQLRKMVKMGQF